MKLAARRQLRWGLAFFDLDIREPVFLKNSFYALYHLIKNYIGIGTTSQFNSYLKLFFGGLHQLNAPGLIMIKIKNQGRQSYIFNMK